MTCVGRVLCDAVGARLSAGAAMLEGSVDTSGGEHVALDVAAVECVRLFPGQVVAVSGTNPSGHKCVAARVHTDFHAPPAMTPMPQLSQWTQQQGASVGHGACAVLLSSMRGQGCFALCGRMRNTHYHSLHATRLDCCCIVCACVG